VKQEQEQEQEQEQDVTTVFTESSEKGSELLAAFSFLSLVRAFP